MTKEQLAQARESIIEQILQLDPKSKAVLFYALVGAISVKDAETLQRYLKGRLKPLEDEKKDTKLAASNQLELFHVCEYSDDRNISENNASKRAWWSVFTSRLG